MQKCSEISETVSPLGFASNNAVTLFLILPPCFFVPPFVPEIEIAGARDSVCLAAERTSFNKCSKYPQASWGLISSFISACKTIPSPKLIFIFAHLSNYHSQHISPILEL